MSDRARALRAAALGFTNARALRFQEIPFQMLGVGCSCDEATAGWPGLKVIDCKTSGLTVAN